MDFGFLARKIGDFVFLSFLFINGGAALFVSNFCHNLFLLFFFVIYRAIIASPTPDNNLLIFSLYPPHPTMERIVCMLSLSLLKIFTQVFLSNFVSCSRPALCISPDFCFPPHDYHGGICFSRVHIWIHKRVDFKQGQRGTLINTCHYYYYYYCKVRKKKRNNSLVRTFFSWIVFNLVFFFFFFFFFFFKDTSTYNLVALLCFLWLFVASVSLWNFCGKQVMNNVAWAKCSGFGENVHPWLYIQHTCVCVVRHVHFVLRWNCCWFVQFFIFFIWFFLRVLLCFFPSHYVFHWNCPSSFHCLVWFSYFFADLFAYYFFSVLDFSSLSCVSNKNKWE